MHKDQDTRIYCSLQHYLWKQKAGKNFVAHQQGTSSMNYVWNTDTEANSKSLKRMKPISVLMEKQLQDRAVNTNWK